MKEPKSYTHKGAAYSLDHLRDAEEIAWPGELALDTDYLDAYISLVESNEAALLEVAKAYLRLTEVVLIHLAGQDENDRDHLIMRVLDSQSTVLETLPEGIKTILTTPTTEVEPDERKGND